MIKLRKTLGTLGLSVLILFTGCAGKGTLGQLTESTVNSDTGNEDTQIGLVPITELKESFEEKANQIKARSFDNINFEGAYFSFPEADEIYALKYVKSEFTLSRDEAYDYMCRRIDEFLPGRYSDQEKREEIEFFEFTLDTENPGTLLSNENSYVEVFCGMLRGFDRGDLAKHGRYEEDIPQEYIDKVGEAYFKELHRFDPVSGYPTVFYTEDLQSKQTFHLASGDISIAEAADFTEKFVSETEISMRDIPFKMTLHSVYVLDIGEGCFAFYFTVVPQYKQMNYDCAQIDGSSFGISPISNTTNEINIAGHAVMYEKDDICRYKPGMLPYYYDIVETDSRTSVIPLEKAAEIASEHLSWNMRFKVQSVSAVYKEFSDMDRMECPDNETYNNRKITVRPCWKFLLRPTTGALNRYYHVYVDMLTGNVDTFVQLMCSEE